MVRISQTLQLPVLITTYDDHSDVYVPDFSITVTGVDNVATIADTISKVSAIYYYNIERNVVIPLKTTYEEALEMLMKWPRAKQKISTVFYIGLVVE